ncbi:hypothetical protein GOV06_03390 [Candidatus Woesearchaeota archaeon]|nr:hypothetical protein [Candidatus Woesearchaeota archaeon]
MKINKGKSNEELVNRYKARLKAREEKPVEEPEPLEEKVEKPLEERLHTSGEDCLIYASGGNIWLYDESQGTEGVISSRGEIITALCIHKGELYEGYGKGKVRNVNKDKQIATFEPNINDLCSHDGRIYAASEKDIFTINTGIVGFIVRGKHIATEETGVFALCSYDEELHKALSNGRIHSVYNYQPYETIIAKRDGAVRDLCSHDGELYDAGVYEGIYLTHQNVEFSQTPPISALCSYNGRLLYSPIDGGGIYDAESGKKFMDKNAQIFAMLSIDRKTMDKLQTDIQPK